jgi:hypothetical protein
MLVAQGVLEQAEQGRNFWIYQSWPLMYNIHVSKFPPPGARQG